MRRFLILTLPLLLAASSACSGKDEAPPCVGVAKINLKSSVAELRSKVALPIEIELSDSGGANDPHPLKVVLLKNGAVVKTLVDAPKPLGKVALELTPSEETSLTTGQYDIKASCGCPTTAKSATPGESTASLYVVRLGATKVLVTDGEGGGRVPLMYHALNKTVGNSFPIPDTLAGTTLSIPDGEADLDAKDGTARAFAPPWDDVGSPPVDASGAVIETGNTLPVSLIVGTKPDLVFTIGKTAGASTGTQPSGLTAPGIPPIRVVVEGVPGADTALATEGGDATVRLATSPVPAVDKVDFPLKWHFEVKSSDGSFATIPGSDQSTILRFYGVLGNGQGTVPPNVPWVAIVDEATMAIAGKASDAPKARAALVDHIYNGIGLSYDRVSGASVYTTYAGGWTSANFNLSGFIGRTRGKVVNCTDCASILSTYANMIGADLHYAIILKNFALNPIQGIGASSFGSPFVSGGMSFSYHAVTTPDKSVTIDDATLAVDGDDDPKTAPHTLKLVQNLAGDDYLLRLSPTAGSGNPTYQYTDQLTKVR